MDGILLVNKPKGITSHTLVQKVRKRLGISRIGHTGTLDPLAEGLMILTVGKATKILPFMSHFFKEYVATMKLGERSDTLDCTGEILQKQQVPSLSESQIVEVLNSFLGESEQLPPMYSAKKVNGVKLYDLARRHQEVERKSQKIVIREIELLDHRDDQITFRCLCSTGTYIRVLIEDIAERLNTIALMSSLKRTAIDNYRLEDALEIDEIDIDTALIPAYEVLRDYQYVELEDISDVINGRRIKLEENAADVVMITHHGEVLACYQRQDELHYCKRGLW
jgi:tRNA pseudouridine55 synthase